MEIYKQRKKKKNKNNKQGTRYSYMSGKIIFWSYQKEYPKIVEQTKEKGRDKCVKEKK